MSNWTRALLSRLTLIIASAATSLLFAGSSFADPFFFSTGNPNGLMATASRPGTGGVSEIESADDFIVGTQTRITSATFTGLLVPPVVGGTPTVGDVIVEIYRVFPNDSTNPPSGHVPTRANSPSDVAFASRDAAASDFSFSTSTLSASFTAANSVKPGGINPSPNQTTGGNGPVTGTEVLFTINFINPFDLPADHYFFIPQVQVSGGTFMWLSAPKPIVSPGTPFLPDLQSWTRDNGLDPDWLRIGTDIVGGAPLPAFNAAFTLNGTTPEPGTALLLGMGMIALWWGRRRNA